MYIYLYITCATDTVGFFAPAIRQMASPNVIVNSEKIDSNILIVTLNSSKITPAHFYDMMLKVFKGCNVIVIVLPFYSNVYDYFSGCGLR